MSQFSYVFMGFPPNPHSKQLKLSIKPTTFLGYLSISTKYLVLGPEDLKIGLGNFCALDVSYFK